MPRFRYWAARLPWIPAIRRERFDSFGCGLIGLVAFILLAVAVGRLDSAPAMPTPITLTAWAYHPDPAGPSATVLVDRTVAPTLPFRPWRMVLAGGGFAPGTGVAPLTYTPGTDALIDHWHARGDVVIFVGYTVADSNLPGGGAFDPALWTTIAPAHLAINAASITSRHGEADIVHAIQSLRYSGIPGVPDLDRRDGRGVVFGKSAGSLLAWWVGGGRDRADPLAFRDRFRVSTTVATTIHHPTIVHFSALPETWVQNHYADASGVLPAAIGDVPDATLAHGSVLRWGYTAQPPAFCSAPEPQQFHGSHTWQNFQHVLNTSQLHPIDHVFAAAIMPGANTGSVYLEPNQPIGDAHAARAAWVDAIEAALQ
jgi:hypothetical protein